MNTSAELVLDGGGPIEEQIESQIRRLVQEGILVPGEELPTVRAVAVGLAINPHAVEQAYDQLERAGWVTRDDGSSPRVAAPPGGQGDTDLKQQCEVFLQWAAANGYSFADVLHALHDCLKGEVHHDQAH
jgi:GntR family transcriptional regulator